MTQDNKPQRASPKELEAEPLEKGKSGGKMQGMMGGNGLLIGIMIVIVLIVAYLAPNFVGVNPVQYKKDIAAINGSISAAQSDIKATKDSITATVGTIPSTVSKSVTDAITPLNTTIGTMQQTITDLKAQIASSGVASNNAVSKVGDLNNQFTQLNTQFTALQKTVSGIDLTSINTSIASLQASVKDLTAQVKALTTTTTTVTTTTPTTTTTTTPTNNVGIAVVTPQIVLNPANSYNNAFNVTITNNSAKGIYGGQIAFSLQVIGLATGETVNTALSGTPLVNSYITWRSPTWSPPFQAYFIGDYSGYINAGSSVTLTINTSVVSSSQNVFINIGSPTISGYTSY